VTEEVKEHLQTSIIVNFHHISWYPTRTHIAVFQMYMDSVGYSFTNHSIVRHSASIKNVTSHHYSKLGHVSVLLRSTAGGVLNAILPSNDREADSKD